MGVSKHQGHRGPKDQINARILQTMLFGIPLVLGLRIRMCLRGLWGLLHGSDRSQCLGQRGCQLLGFDGGTRIFFHCGLVSPALGIVPPISVVQLFGGSSTCFSDNSLRAESQERRREDSLDDPGENLQALWRPSDCSNAVVATASESKAICQDIALAVTCQL